MRLFDLDSPLMQGLTKFANVMLLNILAGIFCIPIITAGASLTAMHYVSLKMARDEDCYIVKDFMKSFKANFKEATILWILVLVAAGILGVDYYFLTHVENLAFIKELKIAIMIIAIIALFTVTFLFPTLAKFDNPVFRTIKNAFVISILQFPKTILMIILNVFPIVLAFVSIRFLPIIMFFGLAAPAFFGALLYSKFFRKLEDQIKANSEVSEENADSEEDERIFHDELDASLVDNDTK